MEAAVKIKDKIINSIKRNYIIILFILIACGLRFYKLTYYDIWYDEARSFFKAKDLRYPFIDYHLFFYYFILQKWISLFGYSLFVLRSLSALFGILSVYPFFKISEMLFNRKCAIFATLIFVFSPFQIWYSQEARNYSLMVLESLFFFYYLLSFIKTANKNYLYASLLVAFISFLTDYPIIAFLIFLVFLFIKKLSKKFILFFLSTFLLFSLFCLKIMSAQFDVFKKLSFWAPKPLWINPFITFNNFLFSYIRRPWFNIITLIFTAILILLIIFSNQENKNKTLLKWLIFFPIISILVISKSIFSLYLDRAFIYVSPFFYMLLTTAILDLKNKLWKRMFYYTLSFLILASLFLYYTGTNEVNYHLQNPFWYRMHTGVSFKHPYRNVAQFLINNCVEGDHIIFSNKDIGSPLKYYMRYIFKDKKRLPRIWVAMSVVVESGSHQAKDFKENTDNKIIDRDSLPGEAKKGMRYWLLSSAWNRGDSPFIGCPNSNVCLVREYMLKHYKKIKTLVIDNIIIDVFEI